MRLTPERSIQGRARRRDSVSKDSFKDQLSKPEVIEGELRLLKESGAGIR
jgi:hypothetical protein